MHLPINVKPHNNISKCHMGFNAAFKGLNYLRANDWCLCCESVAGCFFSKSYVVGALRLLLTSNPDTKIP
jgi:hypothetical protein